MIIKDKIIRNEIKRIVPEISEGFQWKVKKKLDKVGIIVHITEDVIYNSYEFIILYENYISQFREDILNELLS